MHRPRTLFACGAVVLLVACSNTNRSPAALPASTTTAATSAPSAPSSTATTAAPLTSTSATKAPGTTAAATGTSRCHTSQLAATDDGGQGAAGTFFGQVVFRNISTQTCTMFGFPGLQRLDAAHRRLPTEVTRVAAKPPTLVTLSAQQQASFGYSYCNGCNLNDGTGRPCPPAAAFVEITPPDETDFIVAQSTMHPCEKTGTISVSAVAPDKTGHAF